MDRRVSLPSFQEIAGALPKPATLTGNATAPQPIPQKIPASSPHHNERHTSEYGNPGYYSSDNRYAIYSNRPPLYQQPRQQQAHASSYPRNDGDFIPSPLVVHSHPLKHYDISEPAHSIHGGVISRSEATNGHQARVPPRNVHVVAQTGAAAPGSADPIRLPTHGNASSLPHSASSFMHSPPSSSSRFAPYHMVSPAATSAETGTTRVPSSLSPAYKHSTGVGSLPSRASDIAMHQQQHYPQQHYQQQHRAAPVVSSPPGAYSQQASNMSVSPLTLSSSFGPSSTHSNHQRELSVPELVEEDNMDYDDNTPQNGMVEDGSADGGMSTAKIRTIHKLAERRRRREMKNLFDTLRKSLPIDKSVRLSKWEVLKKAIEVIGTQENELRRLRQQQQQQQ
ncbi:hypothetical protein IWW37_003924 [Coemansia sp. RSA 2050]|nr:hypothetical protein IWW37_003924 [Coemansia sp. RSA 2050]KAJ2737092.1 hypothetical protein IW152_000355 [Coemansia sp. BCRC 34962]